MGRRYTVAMLALVATLSTACGSGGGGGDAETSITVYSGRSEELVGPLLERFEQATGIQVNVRYGDTAEMAAQILEEGDNSPADVFFGQDAGALSALQQEGVFADLPSEIVDRVPPDYRSPENRWVGTSGRVRVIAFNPTLVDEADVPDGIDGLTEPAWKGKVGWAPTNGSFQIFVTALREMRGEADAEAWLRAMMANDAKVYPSNDTIAEAIAEGEITLGLVNHYYPFEIREEIPDADVEDHFLTGGDPGGLVNVAGAGILRTSDAVEAAERFVAYLLSEAGQRYFVEQTFEYPLVEGIEPIEQLPPLSELEPPDIDLWQLADLEGTLTLLGKVGLL